MYYNSYVKKTEKNKFMLIYIYLFIYLNVGIQKDFVRQNIEEGAV